MGETNSAPVGITLKWNKRREEGGRKIQFFRIWRNPWKGTRSAEPYVNLGKWEEAFVDPARGRNGESKSFDISVWALFAFGWASSAYTFLTFRGRAWPAAHGEKFGEKILGFYFGQ